MVLSAPSGAGKTSIAKSLRDADPEVVLSTSVTTRAPRAGEPDGLAYHFRTQAEFDQLVARDELLEWASVFGRCYGTPRAPVAEALARGRDVVFDIDWQGFRQLRAALPGDIVGVFILPPSLADLEQRLGARGDHPEAIARRMAMARDEMRHCPEYDYVVLNADLRDAIVEVRTILRAARAATRRQMWLERYLGTPTGV